MKIFIETFIGRKNEQTKYLHQCSCQYNNTDMIKELKWWQEISAGIKSKDEFLLGVKQVVRDEINRLKEENFKMNLVNNETHKCPKCQSNLRRLESKNKKGKFYWGCSNWKNCDVGLINDDNGNL